MLFQDVNVIRMRNDRIDRKINGENHILSKNKNERNGSLETKVSKLTSADDLRHSEKVSLYTSFMKKGSIAVETILVLPLFFFGVIAMISFMDIYKVQTEHLTKLCEYAKEAGMYAYLLDDSEEIEIPDLYSYKPISGFLNLPAVRTYNNVKVHAWTGKEFGSNRDTESGEREHMVYMTETGNVYHVNENCTYLNLSIHNVSGNSVASMRNEYGERYAACESCSRHQTAASTVYITERGNRYHNSVTCSGLKRSVRLVKESEVSGEYHVCSRCG